MDFSLSEEQRLLVETARRFVETELIPLEQEVEESGRLDAGDRARDLREVAGARAVRRSTSRPNTAAAGSRAVDTCLVEEQFGRTTDILIRRALRQCLRGAARRQRGAEESAGCCPRCTASACSRLLHRARAGSDAAGIKTRARRDGDGWVLYGPEDLHQRRRVSRISSWSRRSPIPAAGARGISLFIVDKDMPGFTVGRDQPMMGLRGTQPCRAVLRRRAARAGTPARRRRQRAASRLRDARAHPAGADRRARRRQGHAHLRHDDRPMRASASSSARRSASSSWCSRCSPTRRSRSRRRG